MNSCGQRNYFQFFCAKGILPSQPLNNGGDIWWDQQIIHNEITPAIVNRKRCQNPVATFANQFEIEKPNKQDCNFVHFAISVSQVVGVWVGILCPARMSFIVWCSECRLGIDWGLTGSNIVSCTFNWIDPESRNTLPFKIHSCNPNCRNAFWSAVIKYKIFYWFRNANQYN